MSQVRTLISIAVIFSMSLTPIYGYAGDATYYGMKNHIVAQPPVVGAVLKSLGDNQFYIPSTIGNLDLVPSIFTEADKPHEKKITDIINAFSSMGVHLCTSEKEKIMQEEVQYINTFLVDSEVYSNQKRITLVDRRRGVVNNGIKIKTGELITAWPLNLFHFQAPSFTSTTNEEIVASMETAIEAVQGVYTRVFSNSNEENPSQKEESAFNGLERCIETALSGVVTFGLVVAAGAVGYTMYEIINLPTSVLDTSGAVRSQSSLWDRIPGRNSNIIFDKNRTRRKSFLRPCLWCAGVLSGVLLLVGLNGGGAVGSSVLSQNHLYSCEFWLDGKKSCNRLWELLRG